MFENTPLSITAIIRIKVVLAVIFLKKHRQIIFFQNLILSVCKLTLLVVFAIAVQLPVLAHFGFIFLDTVIKILSLRGLLLRLLLLGMRLVTDELLEVVAEIAALGLLEVREHHELVVELVGLIVLGVMVVQRRFFVVFQVLVVKDRRFWTETVVVVCTLLKIVLDTIVLFLLVHVLLVQVGVLTKGRIN